jgi:hypothetical protein
MKEESVTVVNAGKSETGEKIDPSAWRSAARVTPQLSGLENKAPQPAASQNLGERIKSFFAKVAQALEGDHDTHKYRH